jgi:hypothetical protein
MLYATYRISFSFLFESVIEECWNIFSARFVLWLAPFFLSVSVVFVVLIINWCCFCSAVEPLFNLHVCSWIFCCMFVHFFRFEFILSFFCLSFPSVFFFYLFIQQNFFHEFHGSWLLLAACGCRLSFVLELIWKWWQCESV